MRHLVFSYKFQDGHPIEKSVGNGVSEKIINNGVLEKNEISDEKMIFEARNRKEKKNISWADIVHTQVEH